MRVTCPNCDRKSLLDAASLSDAPVQVACARCGSPFRVSIICEKTSTDQHAAQPTREPHSMTTSEPTCVVLDLDDAGEALRRAQASAFTAEDKYRLGARLLNLSPLRLLLAGCAFVLLVALCDLLLAPRALTTQDAALSHLQNQATNRAIGARRVGPSNNEGEDSLADETSARAQTTIEMADAKPAPISDTRASQTDSLVSVNTAAADPVVDAQPSSNAVEVSFANAREKIKPDASAADQSSAKFTLQLASYRAEEEAQELARKLQAAGFEARVVTEQNSKRAWYCVQTRLFDTREGAGQYLAELRAQGFAASYTVREIN
ncbi:MAG: hypothetical protein QOE33_1498 [Acidobacteriota bacterium]|nr:hypothetical protein [Acidobacteriota bacterium]